MFTLEDWQVLADLGVIDDAAAVKFAVDLWAD